ncbi:MAG: D-tyrosyl-tRNA(Tyr) deacylase [Actinomycetales bacterium]|nr:D-tyrosyl-tRNA(Tyr) deacylase [Actinomycetales bacterium]
MRAVVQRSWDGSVAVAGSVVGSFTGPGLVVLVGVTHNDSLATAHRLADKVYDLRIFDREHAPPGRDLPDARELSASDLGLPLLVISQFTLYGETRKGRRPTWDAAAPRPVAEPLVDAVVERLRERGAEVSTGIFGADMRVTLTNDGPITILLEV